MKLLTLSQIRYLTLTPWSTATVALGVMLGVTSVVAVHQLSVRVAVSLDAATPAYFASVSHLLERDDLDMNHYFALRSAWRRGALGR